MVIVPVDGFAIRQKHLDFTNGANPHSQSYVPSNELWIDCNGSAREQRLWTLRQMAEYLYGFDRGQQIEIQARRHTGQAKFWKQQWIKPNWYIVNGEAVRDLYYVDYTLGGHWLRYDFIPKGEYWLDSAQDVRDIPFTAIHEGLENALMSDGWTYDDAHNQAQTAERCARARY